MRARAKTSGQVEGKVTVQRVDDSIFDDADRKNESNYTDIDNVEEEVSPNKIPAFKAIESLKPKLIAS